jgi:hypothetical protein
MPIPGATGFHVVVQQVIGDTLKKLARKQAVFVTVLTVICSLPPGHAATSFGSWPIVGDEWYASR